MDRKKWKKQIGATLALCLAAATVLAGCGQDNAGAGSSVTEPENNKVQTDYSNLTTPGVKVDLVGDYSDKAIAAEWDEATATKITFSGNEIAIDGAGATANAGVVTITEGGTYVLTGNGSEVQVVAEVNEEDNIQLVLKDVTLENSSIAPINIINGKNAFVTLAEGSENIVRDTRAAYVEPEEGEETTTTEGEEPIESAIYSEIDLILNGTGSLTVEAGYDDGIRTKDDMEIISGTYHVTCQDDAFVGKDSISVRDGNITTVAKGTALKSNKSDDLEKGYIVIDGGTFDLIATEGDGLHAEYALVINDGDILIRESEEGLEAMNIVINGGNIELFATDDGVNISEAEEYAALFGSQAETSQDTITTATDASAVTPDSTTMQLPTDGTTPPELPEGMKQGQMPTDGTMPELPEGMEVPEDMGGRGFGSGMKGDMSGGMTGDAGAMMEENTSVDHIEGALLINGGYLHVTAQGDGLDSNGDILITGGTTIVCGPTNSGNGTLDYADTFDMTGGVLAISGNQGMEQNITSETIPVVTMNFSGKQAAGSDVSITDADGKELLTFTAKQEFSYVSFASRDLTVDGAYVATVGKNTAEGKAAINQNGGMGGMMMPGGQRPGGQMPENFDSSQLPDSQMQQGGRPEMPNGEVPTMPEGETPQKTQPSDDAV